MKRGSRFCGLIETPEYDDINIEYLGDSNPYAKKALFLNQRPMELVDVRVNALFCLTPNRQKRGVKNI
jgi:hypothetical protein